MDLSRHFPFDGEVVWLTADQGGRRTGPPPTTVFAPTGFVPPALVDSGLASFAIRGFSHDLLRSPAEGVWLLAENLGAQRVQPGSVVVITEGSHPVAYFHVQRLTGEVKPYGPRPEPVGTLHDAMIEVLRTRRWITLQELADQIGAAELWRRPSDGAWPDASQVRRRAVQSNGRYRHLFEVKDGMIRLRIRL